MRHLPLPASLYIRNRARLAQLLPPGSLAVFNSNDIMPSGADGTMPFRQHQDIYYLSGADQEESILLLFPDARNPAMREVLFLRETSEKILLWEGYRLTKEQARAATGIETVYWTTEFENLFRKLASEAENLYLNTNEHLRAEVAVETRDARFIAWCKQHYPLHNYRRLAPLMQQLRTQKGPEEVAALSEACRITEEGFRRVLSMVKPGVTEYEIEAEFTYAFVRNRSKGHAYTPIVASGANACILHYIDNTGTCADGELLLIDAGAEYANYNADMTRCIPVNGTFSPRQKQVYNAVLRVHKAAAAMLVPGNTFAAYNKAVGALIENELIGLGLLDAEAVKNQNPEAPLYKRYFMHGVSHFLGLSVHDVGDFDAPFVAGTVFTVEPGIYIKEEGLGIRIENNFLITENGAPLDLMAHIPIEAEEIEALMAAAKK